jgi:O-antigen/teichoic acid export membrane protein
MGQVLAVAGAVVGVRLLTELLPPTVYGELALGMTLATLLNQVVFGPLGNGASRFYAVAQEAQVLPNYWAALKHMVAVATGWTLVAAVPVGFALVVAGYTPWLGVATAALVFALLSGYNGILDGIQNAARQRSIVALHQGLASWGRFLVAAALIFWLGTSSAIAMAGFSLAMACVLGSQAWFLKRSLPGLASGALAQRHKFNHWQRHIFTYSWPFAAWGWLTWAQQASDRLALGIFGSTEAVGQYAVLYQLGYYPVLLASGMAVQLAAPVMFQEAGTGDDTTRLRVSTRLNHSMALWTAIATVAGWALLSVVHRELFSLLVATQYRQTSHLLPWMVLAGGLFAVGQIFSLQFMTSLNTRRLVGPKVVTAILGIAFTVVGATLYGIAGVVGASVVWSLLYSMVLLACLWTPQRLQPKDETYEGVSQDAAS